MRRRVLIGVAVLAAAAAVAHWLPMPAFVPEQVTAAHSPQPAAPEGKPEERLSALPERAPLGAPRGALFSAPPPPKPAPKPAAQVAEPKPVPPPMPYRVAGRIVHNGANKVVVAKGERVFTVAEGDKLEGGYRVERVSADEITLVYEPLGMSERLAIAAAPAAPRTAPASAGGSVRAAQLHWDGPERVKAGSVFELALKVTSSEPVRSAPLRVSYDPQLLEPVAVRAGKFFGADASFSYRIDPSGSILVSASGASAPADDAELVILSFKPVRAAPSAEVKLAALSLQRGAGVPLPSEPLGAFRTAITQ